MLPDRNRINKIKAFCSDVGEMKRENLEFSARK
jgi:hypothetical protein